MRETKLTSIVNVITFSLFIITMIIIFVITPDNKISTSEKRTLAQIPELSIESIKTTKFMKNLEDYTLDQFPYRDTFRKIKTYYETDIIGKSDSAGYTEDNGHIHKVDYELHSQTLERTFNKLMGIGEELKDNSEGKRVFWSIIPDKSYYNDSVQTIDYAEAMKILYQTSEGKAEYIDITDTLKEKNYYFTDLHWKQETIIDTANLILESMGKTKISKDSYVLQEVTTEFNGSYGSASAFSVNKDIITILTNDKLNNIKVFDYETNKYINIYNLDKAKGIDPYDTYLGGAKSLLRIENPDSNSDNKLVIFRDSFTSSIAPLLIDEYSEVLLVDLRYINYNYLKKVVDLDKHDDILFIYNILVLNESESFKF